MNDKVFEVKIKLEDIEPVVKKIKEEVEVRVREETHRCTSVVEVTTSDGRRFRGMCIYWFGHPKTMKHRGEVKYLYGDEKDSIYSMLEWE